ncbi:hypothetical protein WR25_05979 [Diploscapter pachys]|uniref:Lysophospholipid acyltransferase 7 n=1 Tax=Diploscapter pachys TaxID=2018661 RepID=A0A2A2LQS9_9BILA|nr:hypothetical protein WR25_05979 [Diploscapter pachys]
MSLDLLGLLSRDDWIYAGILLLSFGISWGIRCSQNEKLARQSGGAIGFAMALLILGWKIFYSLPITAFVAICIKYSSQRHLTTLVFISTFVYLMFVRYLHFLFDVNELASQANGVQLLITLRTIGLTFEVSDARRYKKDPSQFREGKRFLTDEPSFFDIFNYFYHFCGLFTGPYYSYQMLVDSYEPVLLKSWSPMKEIRVRAIRLCWSAPLFILFNKMFPLDGLRSDSVWDMSFTERMIYAAAVFVVFRTRVYSAWAVSESICVTMGLGIYPEASKPRCVVGPTDTVAYEKMKSDPNAVRNSEAIVNIDIKEIEMSDGFRSGIRAWNKSVQSWLALYVHSRSNRLYRVELTLFVSALWHGTYAGYFMSFLIVPMCAAVEDIIFSMVSVDPATNERPKWFRYLYTFTLRCRGFDFLATGFLLKNFVDTHRFWSSLYYWLLLVMLPVYAIHKICAIMGHRTKKAPKNLNNNDDINMPNKKEL